MDSLNMKPYELYQRLQHEVSKQTVYNFVAHGKVIRTDLLAAVMREIGLAIVVRNKRNVRGMKKGR